MSLRRIFIGAACICKREKAARLVWRPLAALHYPRTPIPYAGITQIRFARVGDILGHPLSLAEPSSPTAFNVYSVWEVL